MRGRPPKKSLSPEQALAADAFVGGAETPSSGSGRADLPGAAVSEPGAPPRAEAPPTSEATAVRVPVRRPASRPEAASAGAFPWEAAYVRDDVVKGYALRLPEPLYLKLKWVAAERGQSMNELIQGAVADVVADHLGEGGVRAGSGLSPIFAL